MCFVLAEATPLTDEVLVEQRVQDFETTIRVVIFTGGKVTVSGGAELPKEKLWTLLLQQAMTRGASSCGARSDCTAEARARAALLSMQEVLRRMGTELYPLERLNTGIDPAWCDTETAPCIARSHRVVFCITHWPSVRSRAPEGLRSFPQSFGRFEMIETMPVKMGGCIDCGYAADYTDITHPRLLH
jgi:hypothetical protein